MKEINFLEKYQSNTKRNYIQRVIEHDKADCASLAKEWSFDYWDGDRKYGYGGYHYDGRWNAVAQDLAKYYELKSGDKVLDIGCGKGFLLYELTQVVPGIEVTGIDISKYAIENSKEEIRKNLLIGSSVELPFENQEFDFVFSINTFHNLKIEELLMSLKEMQRVGKSDKKWCCVESYRNEKEKVNLLYWQLTCESFYRPEGWKYLLNSCGYQGDCGFIYFT